MPAEPYSEQLRAKVVARLAAIASGATYHYTPGEVGPDWKDVEECQDLAAGAPYYGVVDGLETRPRLTFTKVNPTLDLIVVVWVLDTENRRRALRRAIADVITAVYTDETWDGLALATDVLEINTDQAALVAKPHAYGEVLLRIEYERDRTAV